MGATVLIGRQQFLFQQFSPKATTYPKRQKSKENEVTLTYLIPEVNVFDTLATGLDPVVLHPTVRPVRRAQGQGAIHREGLHEAPSAILAVLKG